MSKKADGQGSIEIDEYRVKASSKVRLAKWPTRVEPLYASKKFYRKLLSTGTRRLIELQRMLYAHNRYALLLIFQAMDTAGKDGAIRHVMSGVNPQGCRRRVDPYGSAGAAGAVEPGSRRGGRGAREWLDGGVFSGLS